MELEGTPRILEGSPAKPHKTGPPHAAAGGRLRHPASLAHSHGSHHSAGGARCDANGISRGSGFFLVLAAFCFVFSFILFLAQYVH